MNSREFVKLCRELPSDMDENLIDQLNSMLKHTYDRAYQKCWSFNAKLKEVGRRNMYNLIAERDEIKEKLSQKGFSGKYLENKADELMRFDIDYSKYLDENKG